MGGEGIGEPSLFLGINTEGSSLREHLVLITAWTGRTVAQEPGFKNVGSFWGLRHFSACVFLLP